MAEPFKNLVNAEGVKRLAEEIQQVHGSFDGDAFAKEASEGLDALELKARVAHIAAALHTHLPAGPAEAYQVLVAALPPPMQQTKGFDAHFYLWPVLQVVEDTGEQAPSEALDAIHAMTQRWSAEFAIRPLLLAHPETTLARLHTWATDPSPHVRRLVSEGSRPRLPWGIRLRPFVEDPEPGIALLHLLVDDPEPYVRKSVANHLNDISKDHPERAVEVARVWSKQGHDWVVRHGLRSLEKQGHPGALEVLGYAPPELQGVQFRAGPAQVAMGEEVSLELDFVSHAAGALVIDYAVHFQRRRGTSRKVFKWSKRQVEQGEAVELRTSHAFREVTTRAHHPGEHRIEAQVNGVVVGAQIVHLGQ